MHRAFQALDLLTHTRSPARNRHSVWDSVALAWGNDKQGMLEKKEKNEKKRVIWLGFEPGSCDDVIVRILEREYDPALGLREENHHKVLARHFSLGLTRAELPNSRFGQ